MAWKGLFIFYAMFLSLFMFGAHVFVLLDPYPFSDCFPCCTTCRLVCVFAESFRLLSPEFVSWFSVIGFMFLYF